ncbi:glycine oxidase ThiO [Paenibacillus sp. GSMTC-2017]|uniref:glycine oxidase ThiO n=1 Tax=Paenibacillus sp. GSMTC-2017 TaxID=2794350 RepID=UPI0018D62E20|nr:glycine oxidase ThiO [Paenibacillus sp. GSMTC-2017]MBH5318521.1 glycine oxidase ThiO [Paenibacillus sp. GSMTC-2017]
MSGSVLVVGGGIIGLSCAFEAARRGYKVTLLEPDRIGGQASGAAAGMLAPFSENTEQPDAFFQLCLSSLKQYPTWVNAVEQHSGISVEWINSGSLNVFQHEADLLPVQSRLRWQNKWGARAEFVEGSALKGIEPNLSQEAIAAIYYPEESHVYAPKLVEALEMACRNLGVTFFERAGDIQSIELIRGGGVSLLTSRLLEEVRAERVIICSGAWTGMYEKWLDISIPIHPIRGQICSYEGSLEEVRHMVFSSQAYWVGKKEGRIVCGASEDVAGFETSVTERGIKRLIKSSERWFPFFSGRQTVHQWAGLRPATTDGLPLLGAVGEEKSVIMAAGHYRNGILLSPITALLVGDLLDGRSQSASLLPFSPYRFTYACNN